MNADRRSSGNKTARLPGSHSELLIGDLFDEFEYSRSTDVRQQLLDEIVIRMVPVADRLASHYNSRGVSTDDLQQVARAALVHASRRFRGGGEGAFLAFVIPSIRGELKRYFRDRGWTVRPPRRIQEARLAMINARSSLLQELGREPSVIELAETTGFEERTIREAQGVGHCYQPESLDQPADDSHGSWIPSASTGAVDSGFEEAEARMALRPLLNQLPARDRELIVLRFFEGLTQTETGRQLGISQVQVSRDESRILKELRLALAPNEAA
jgi:RNA polymerase sigma-B factor